MCEYISLRCCVRERVRVRESKSISTFYDTAGGRERKREGIRKGWRDEERGGAGYRTHLAEGTGAAVFGVHVEGVAGDGGAVGAADARLLVHVHEPAAVLL
jgi:hypothetical protein